MALTNWCERSGFEAESSSTHDLGAGGGGGSGRGPIADPFIGGRGGDAPVGAAAAADARCGGAGALIPRLRRSRCRHAFGGTMTHNMTNISLFVFPVFDPSHLTPFGASIYCHGKKKADTTTFSDVTIIFCCDFAFVLRSVLC